MVINMTSIVYGYYWEDEQLPLYLTMSVRERNDSRYKQLEISPMTIEQELWPIVYEQRPTDLRRNIV